MFVQCRSTMMVLVFCVLFCLVTAQESKQYQLHSLPTTRTFENEPKVVFLQNPQLHLDSESHRMQFSGTHTHGPLHTDQARRIIHFPLHATHTSTGESDKDISFDRSQFREPANAHNTQALSAFRNPNQPSGLVNVGDRKITENRPNTVQIHSIGQPKVTRTVYINGVKVENDSEANVASIISALLNPHLPNQYTNQNEPKYDYNQQNNAQVPSYILSHLNAYKPDSEHNKNSNKQIPVIDVRMNHLGNSKLAKLREKGRHVKNATSIYNKPHVNKNNKQVAEDKIIFV